MSGIYGLLILLGGWFFYRSLFEGDTVDYKTLVQAIIMLMIGLGGVTISLRHKPNG
jgi:hypothetical protein